MTYILLAAGKGTRLHPLTMSYPKCLYKLDENTTAIKRMANLIKKYDEKAEIVIVVGFMDEVIKEELGNDFTYLYNPFYSITNSITSLWFAREYLNRKQIAIINADIVMSEEAVKDILCAYHEKSVILLDSSIKTNGDCNVQIEKDKVVVMSKNLKEYYGEYAGVTIINSTTSKKMAAVLEEMIREEQFDQWYEDVVVRMIFRKNHDIFYLDLCDYKWTEIDNVDDLIKAKKIHCQF